MSSIYHHQTFEFSLREETALAVDELSQICEGWRSSVQNIQALLNATGADCATPQRHSNVVFY